MSREQGRPVLRLVRGDRDMPGEATRVPDRAERPEPEPRVAAWSYPHVHESPVPVGYRMLVALDD